MQEYDDQMLARLHVRFVVPMIIGQVLRGEEIYDDVAEYTINSMISAGKPDTALLCIALSAQALAAHCYDLPAARMLKAEADRIVGEYGPVWSANEQNPDGVNDQDVMALLSFIPEDLEALAHMLDATLGAMKDPDDLAASLCDLLAVQAYEHMDIAETELQAVDIPLRSRMPDDHFCHWQAAPPEVDNIIPFPSLQRPE